MLITKYNKLSELLWQAVQVNEPVQKIKTNTENKNNKAPGCVYKLRGNKILGKMPPVKLIE